MHLPDGVLPGGVWFPAAVVSATAVGVAGTRSNHDRRSANVATAGFLGAVVLAVQMVNFPLVGGASAHLTGTSLLVGIAGLEAALLAMASVLTVQCLLLQDGGLLALGSNFADIVLVPALITQLILRLASRRSSREGLPWHLGLAAWLGTIGGAVLTSTQLTLAGTLPWRVAFPWLVGCQALVGLIEAVLTWAVVHTLVSRTSPLIAFRMLSIQEQRSAHVATPRRFTPRFAVLVALAIIAAVVLVPFASKRPDILESVIDSAQTTKGTASPRPVRLGVSSQK